MDARAVERADRELADLNRQAREAAVLAALVLALAIGATHVFPAFALPLLVGGVWVAASPCARSGAIGSFSTVCFSIAMHT
jgi:hypothetical protein